MLLDPRIGEILYEKTIYHYDFDLITGIIDNDIVDKEGNNFTEQLGLVSPCTFDEMMERSYDENYFGVWHVTDSGVNTLSQQSLLEEYNKGKNLVVALIYLPKTERYYRLNYYLIKDDFTGNPHVYVSCIDATNEENSRKEIFGRLQREKIDTEEIIESAEIGIWHIYLYEGEKPRMSGSQKMMELLGVEDKSLSEEEIYDFWFSRIKESSLPSVFESVDEIKNIGFSENEYNYIHPQKGEIIVRCGGTSEKVDGKGYILRGYHSDVTEIVKATEKRKHVLRNTLAVLKEKTDMLKVQQDEKVELQHVLESVAGILYSLHEIDLVNDFVTGYKTQGQVKAIEGNHSKGAVSLMRDVMSAVVTDEHRADALEFTDLTTIADRMIHRDTISREFIGRNIGWFLSLFIVMERDETGRPTKLVHLTREIDEQKKEMEKLIHKANTDELTGLFNRRAYEEEVYKRHDSLEDEEFVYVSLDVNGLKILNDTKGHEAGDELLVGASECMKKAFGPYGLIYRTGGDEFVAILSVDDEKLKEILDKFDETVSNWKGEMVEGLSISYGYVSSHEYAGKSVRELSLVAEKRMYESKSAHYRKKGVDRRGQQDAHRVLCELYTKILKINLTEDTYQVINIDVDEQDGGDSSISISKWIADFGESGGVHPDDKEEYLRKTDLDYMKNYFAGNKTSLHVFYRRKYSDEYKQVMMEIVPANDYRHDNQNLFLYVKNIDN